MGKLLVIGGLGLAVGTLVFGPVYPSPGWPCCTAADAADLALTGTGPAGAGLDWLAGHAGTVIGAALALLGALSQVAAACNLTGLGRVDARLQTAVRWLAGNWGYAVTTIELVELYRTAGPAAALARLAELAGPVPPAGK